MLLSLGALAFLQLNLARGDVNSAVVYLKTKNPNPWITMALVAAGENPDVDYLKSASGVSATDYEAPILALTAAGKDPRTFPNENLIQKLKSFYASNQIGDVSILNDDIFGILALLSAGEAANDAVVQGAKNFVLQNQNADGGWSFAIGSASDTNMTAMAIMALLETGLPKTDPAIAKAIGYLKGAQNTDGGFPYDPESPWGTASDASSDAWVIAAINRLGEKPEDWTKNGHNPREHLLTLQNSAGYFHYQEGTSEDSFSPVTTSYALIALTGKHYPVAKISGPIIPEVSFKLEGQSAVICEGDIAAVNPLELVRSASVVCGFTYHIQDTSFGPYLDQIGNDKAEGTNGWLYAVNFLLPNVGAADYELKDGDYVLWHYGNFNWQPLNTKIDLSAKVVGSGGGSENNQNPGGNTAALNVSIPGSGGSLDFGDLSGGASKIKTVNLTNQGNTALYVESAVTGDDFFRDYIQINSASWRSFSTNLNIGESENEEIKLQLPASYANLGVKSGALIFWGTPAQ